MSDFPRQPLRNEKLFTPPFYTLINRTSRPLTVIVDGVSFVLEPGENPGISWTVAQYAQKQHPRRGTFDRTMRLGESLIAVKGMSAPHECRLIPPGREHLGDELINRKEFPLKAGMEIESLPPAYRLAMEDQAEGGDPMSLTSRIITKGDDS